MKLLINLKGIELTREKLKDFRNVVYVQILLLLTAMLLKGILELFYIPFGNQITESIFFSILGVYVFLLWDMLRNYTRSKWLLIILLILIMGTFFIGFVFINPFFSLIEGTMLKILAGVVMFNLLLVEISVIYFTLIEMFKRDLPISERLLGATCIYLIIGIAFGGLYEIISLINDASIPFNLPLGTLHFMKSISFSFMTLAGIDNPYTCSELIINLSAMESVWGNLFIVFVVGRLLYK
ncbi:MAG TPA: hypothetical protein VK766_07815 [Cytophagaceae bacterium]|jgi:hypothetical protein|nr:hypothetical protein [Cytophagaceae bacterium]